jgi:hypothetical protein
VSDRLDVDHALLASSARRVLLLHLDIGEKDRRSELEDPFEGRVQVDESGSVGSVRLQFEQRVGRVVRKVDS